MYRFNSEYQHPFLSSAARTFLPNILQPPTGLMGTGHMGSGLSSQGMGGVMGGIGGLGMKALPFLMNYFMAKGK